MPKMPRPQSLGDAPIEKKYSSQMRAIAEVLNNFFNGSKSGTATDRTGFILMVFPLNDHGGRCNYIANARREDVIVLLKEQLARFEGQPDVSGRA